MQVNHQQQQENIVPNVWTEETKISIDASLQQQENIEPNVWTEETKETEEGFGSVAAVDLPAISIDASPQQEENNNGTGGNNNLNMFSVFSMNFWLLPPNTTTTTATEAITTDQDEEEQAHYDRLAEQHCRARNNAASVLIQKTFRKHRAMKVLRTTINTVVSLQCVFRAVVVRQELDERIRQRSALQMDSVTRIQSVFRGQHRARLSFSTSLVALRRAVGVGDSRLQYLALMNGGVGDFRLQYLALMNGGVGDSRLQYLALVNGSIGVVAAVVVHVVDAHELCTVRNHHHRRLVISVLVVIALLLPAVINPSSSQLVIANTPSVASSIETPAAGSAGINTSSTVIVEIASMDVASLLVDEDFQNQNMGYCDTTNIDVGVRNFDDLQLVVYYSGAASVAEQQPSLSAPTITVLCCMTVQIMFIDVGNYALRRMFTSSILFRGARMVMLMFIEQYHSIQSNVDDSAVTTLFDVIALNPVLAVASPLFVLLIVCAARDTCNARDARDARDARAATAIQRTFRGFQAAHLQYSSVTLRLLRAAVLVRHVFRRFQVRRAYFTLCAAVLVQRVFRGWQAQLMSAATDGTNRDDASIGEEEIGEDESGRENDGDDDSSGGAGSKAVRHRGSRHRSDDSEDCDDSDDSGDSGDSGSDTPDSLPDNLADLKKIAANVSGISDENLLKEDVKKIVSGSIGTKATWVSYININIKKMTREEEEEEEAEEDREEVEEVEEEEEEDENDDDSSIGGGSKTVELTAEQKRVKQIILLELTAEVKRLKEKKQSFKKPNQHEKQAAVENGTTLMDDSERTRLQKMARSKHNAAVAKLKKFIKNPTEDIEKYIITEGVAIEEILPKLNQAREMYKTLTQAAEKKKESERRHAQLEKQREKQLEEGKSISKEDLEAFGGAIIDSMPSPDELENRNSRNVERGYDLGNKILKLEDLIPSTASFDLLKKTYPAFPYSLHQYHQSKKFAKVINDNNAKWILKTIDFSYSFLHTNAKALGMALVREA